MLTALHTEWQRKLSHTELTQQKCMQTNTVVQMYVPDVHKNRKICDEERK